MQIDRRYLCFPILLSVLLLTLVAFAAEQPEEAAKGEAKPKIAISEDLGNAMMRQASQVKEEFKQQARSLFERTPLGWDWKTIEYLYGWALDVPQKIPGFVGSLLEQSRVLGVAGSLVILTFLIAVFYSIFGQKRLLKRIEARVEPLRRKIPERLYPFFLSALKVVVSALIPLLLLGAFGLINALIEYGAAWFQLLGRLFWLWVIGALVINLLRETLTRGLIQSTIQYGRSMFQVTRLIVLFVVGGLAVFRCAEAFALRKDVLALLQFGIAVSIVVVLFLVLLRKKAFMSLFPELPHRGYRVFVNLLNRYYYPLVLVSFIAALLWCLGYKTFGPIVLTKIWSSAGAYLVITMIYHVLRAWLQRWSSRMEPGDDSAQYLVRSLKSLLLYATVTAAAVVILNLLGLLAPLQWVMSFPVLEIGQSPITLWIIVKAVLILLGFVYASHLLQAYLDYKVYPSFGVDPGLGYALNTFFKYSILAIGFLISLKVVGLDLRLLLVFAGAIGIGIGLGLQNMAANVISGFTIIFGGKIRKGDWIEVSNTVGMVTDIYLRATKIQTRDNVEYLVPNSNLVSTVVINYSLSSPFIRIEVPVGVSYNADPRQVERILLEAAQKEPLVAKYRQPVVRFIEYGDSSINFELLIWIDVRQTPRRQVRSALYFAIFDEFKKAGIEIPFPQRDIHIRSTVANDE
jgi:small-conductance mechanosensitive channel